MKSKEIKKQIKQFLKGLEVTNAKRDYFPEESEENILTGEVFIPGKITIEFKQNIGKPEKTYKPGDHFRIGTKNYSLIYIGEGVYAFCAGDGTTHNGSFYLKAGEELTKDIIDKHTKSDWECL